MPSNGAGALLLATVLQCCVVCSATRGLRRPRYDPSDDDQPIFVGADVPTLRKNAKCADGGVDKWQIHVHQKCPAADTDPDEGADGVPALAAKLSLGNFSRSGKRRESDLRLLETVKKHLRSEDKLQLEAFGLLERLVGAQASEVFALKESWTDDDTEILRKLDDADGGFTPGHLDTKAFAARLPSRAQLLQLLEQKRLALVGNGATLENHTKGEAIDGHAQVARFNGLTGSKLVPADTGKKITIHVMNHGQKPLQDASVAEFDLEWTHPWSSYCRRMHKGGEFQSHGPLFLIRPSVYCALGDGFQEFTRGFLFYWFVGREFEQIDMYGFKGKDHYKTLNEGPPGTVDHVDEKFLEFEHLVYQQLAELSPSMAYV